MGRSPRAAMGRASRPDFRRARRRRRHGRRGGRPRRPRAETLDSGRRRHRRNGPHRTDPGRPGNPPGNRPLESGNHHRQSFLAERVGRIQDGRRSTLGAAATPRRHAHQNEGAGGDRPLQHLVHCPADHTQSCDLMLPAVFGPFRGNARGNAEGNRNAPQTLGGVGHNQRGVVGHARAFILRRCYSGFFVLDRTTRTAPAESGERRERPPLFDRCRGQPMGWVGHPVGHRVGHTHPPAGGVAPVRIYPCGKAPRTARGPDDQPHRAARCVTHSYAPSWSSAASAPRAPERGRACFPRLTPWPCSSAITR